MKECPHCAEHIQDEAIKCRYCGLMLDSGPGGLVYVLHNSAMPDLVKIGETSRDSEQRAKEISGTGTPGRWAVVYEEEVPDRKATEKRIHVALDQYRYTPKKKEHFRVPVKDAIAVVRRIADEDRASWIPAPSPEPVTTFYQPPAATPQLPVQHTWVHRAPRPVAPFKLWRPKAQPAVQRASVEHSSTPASATKHGLGAIGAVIAACLVLFGLIMITGTQTAGVGVAMVTAGCGLVLVLYARRRRR